MWGGTNKNWNWPPSLGRERGCNYWLLNTIDRNKEYDPLWMWGVHYGGVADASWWVHCVSSLVHLPWWAVLAVSSWWRLSWVLGLWHVSPTPVSPGCHPLPHHPSCQPCTFPCCHCCGHPLVVPVVVGGTVVVMVMVVVILSPPHVSLVLLSSVVWDSIWKIVLVIREWNESKKNYYGPRDVYDISWPVFLVI